MYKQKIFILVIFSLFIAVLLFIYSNRLLIPAVILSGSMEPELKAGDFIILHPIINPKNIHKGDIITFEVDNGTRITHRVVNMSVNKSQFWFVTKGDANIKEDQWFVSQDCILGRMICKIPYGGYISRFVRTPLGLFLCIFMPLIILIKELRLY